MIFDILGIKQAAAAPAPAAPAPAAPAAPAPAGGAPAPGAAPAVNITQGAPLPSPGVMAGSPFVMNLPQSGGPPNVDPATGSPMMTQEQAMQLAEAENGGKAAPKQQDPDSPTVKEPGSFMVGLSDRLGKIKASSTPSLLGAGADLDPTSPTGSFAKPSAPARPGMMQPGQKGYKLYDVALKTLLGPMLRTGQVPGGHMTDRTHPAADSFYQAAQDIDTRYPEDSPWKKLISNFAGPVISQFTGGQSGGGVGNTAAEAWQNWQGSQ